MVDDTALLRWLDELGENPHPPLRADRIGLGQSNLIFLVEDGAGQRWILRRPPLGTLLASAHDVLREARILSALQGTPVPVPRILGTLPGDTPWVLMEHVDGLVVDRMSIAESLSEKERFAVGKALPPMLARIHELDLAAIGLADLASHKPYAERQLNRWSQQWDRTRSRELAALDRLTERLRRAVPAQREITLVHGDFHIRNIIIDPHGGEIRAVLDWELCTLGDPLADMGSLLAYWPAPGERPTDSFALCALPGFPSRGELAADYLGVTGRDEKALAFWHALGLWKLAIIREGVLRRAAEDPRNRAAGATPTAAQIDELVETAEDVATDAGF